MKILKTLLASAVLAVGLFVGSVKATPSFYQSPQFSTYTNLGLSWLAGQFEIRRSTTDPTRVVIIGSTCGLVAPYGLNASTVAVSTITGNGTLNIQNVLLIKFWDGRILTSTDTLGGGGSSAAGGGLLASFVDSSNRVVVSSIDIPSDQFKWVTNGSSGALYVTPTTHTWTALQSFIRQITVTSTNVVVIGGGRIGVSTQTPAYDLDVLGDAHFTGTLYGPKGILINPQQRLFTDLIFDFGGNGVADFQLGNGSVRFPGRVAIGQNNPAALFDVNGGSVIIRGGGAAFYILPGTFTVLPNGNVGINESTPTSRLDIVGGSVTIRGPTAGLSINGSEALTQSSVILATNTSGIKDFLLSSTNVWTSSQTFTRQVDISSNLIAMNGGKIGLSTAAPVYDLDVVGGIHFTDTLYGPQGIAINPQQRFFTDLIFSLDGSGAINLPSGGPSGNVRFTNKVSIGAANPVSALEVIAGSITVRGNGAGIGVTGGSVTANAFVITEGSVTLPNGRVLVFLDTAVATVGQHWCAVAVNNPFIYMGLCGDNAGSGGGGSVGAGNLLVRPGDQATSTMSFLPRHFIVTNDGVTGSTIALNPNATDWFRMSANSQNNSSGTIMNLSVSSSLYVIGVSTFNGRVYLSTIATAGGLFTPSDIQQSNTAVDGDLVLFDLANNKFKSSTPLTNVVQTTSSSTFSSAVTFASATANGLFTVNGGTFTVSGGSITTGNGQTLLFIGTQTLAVGQHMGVVAIKNGNIGVIGFVGDAVGSGSGSGNNATLQSPATGPYNLARVGAVINSTGVYLSSGSMAIGLSTPAAQFQISSSSGMPAVWITSGAAPFVEITPDSATFTLSTFTVNGTIVSNSTGASQYSQGAYYNTDIGNTLANRIGVGINYMSASSLVDIAGGSITVRGNGAGIEVVGGTVAAQALNVRGSTVMIAGNFYNWPSTPPASGDNVLHYNSGNIFVGPSGANTQVYLDTGTLASAFNVHNSTTDDRLNRIDADTETLADGRVIVGANRTYFLNSVTPSTPTYYSLLTSSPAAGGEVARTQNVTSAAGLVKISSHVTLPNDPGLTKIPAGIWDFTTWAKPDLVTGLTQLVVTVSTISYEGNVVTEVLSSTGNNLVDTVATLYNMSVVQQSDIILSTSDRILLNVYARATSITGVNVTILFGGTSHYSFVDTPIGAGAGKIVQLDDVGFKSMSGLGGRALAINNDGTAVVAVTTFTDTIATLTAAASTTSAVVDQLKNSTATVRSSSEPFTAAQTIIGSMTVTGGGSITGDFAFITTVTVWSMFPHVVLNSTCTAGLQFSSNALNGLALLDGVSGSTSGANAVIFLIGIPDNFVAGSTPTLMHLAAMTTGQVTTQEAHVLSFATMSTIGLDVSTGLGSSALNFSNLNFSSPTVVVLTSTITAFGGTREVKLNPGDNPLRGVTNMLGSGNCVLAIIDVRDGPASNDPSNVRSAPYGLAIKMKVQQ